MPRTTNSEALTRDRILQTALDLIDRDGLERFSLRNLAEALGVNSKAIYYHVPSKDAIIAGAVDLAFSRLSLPDTHQQSWQKSIRDIVLVYRQFAQRYPSLFLFLMTYNETVPVAFTIDEALAEVIYHAGFSPAETIQIIDMLLLNVAGNILVHLHGSAGKSSDYQQVYAQFQGLPEAQYPTIRALTTQILPHQLTTDPDFAMNVIIRGLEMTLQSKK